MVAVLVVFFFLKILFFCVLFVLFVVFGRRGIFPPTPQKENLIKRKGRDRTREREKAREEGEIEMNRPFVHPAFFIFFFFFIFCVLFKANLLRWEKI